MEKTCSFCKREPLSNHRLHNQQYCSRPECQRARKRRWQKAKLVKDSAYRGNQAAAQKGWCRRNRDYWKEYRRRNPAYAERNRQKQRERNRRRSGSEIAKMDASEAKKIISSGRYRLMPLCNGPIAKMDALIVEIGVISRGCAVETLGP